MQTGRTVPSVAVALEAVKKFLICTAWDGAVDLSNSSSANYDYPSDDGAIADADQKEQQQYRDASAIAATGEVLSALIEAAQHHRVLAVRDSATLPPSAGQVTGGPTSAPSLRRLYASGSSLDDRVSPTRQFGQAEFFFASMIYITYCLSWQREMHQQQQWQSQHLDPHDAHHRSTAASQRENSCGTPTTASQDSTTDDGASIPSRPGRFRHSHSSATLYAGCFAAFEAAYRPSSDAADDHGDGRPSCHAILTAFCPSFQKSLSPAQLLTKQPALMAAVDVLATSLRCIQCRVHGLPRHASPPRATGVAPWTGRCPLCYAAALNDDLAVEALWRLLWYAEQLASDGDEGEGEVAREGPPQPAAAVEIADAAPPSALSTHWVAVGRIALLNRCRRVFFLLWRHWLTAAAAGTTTTAAPAKCFRGAYRLIGVLWQSWWTTEALLHSAAAEDLRLSRSEATIWQSCQLFLSHLSLMEVRDSWGPSAMLSECLTLPLLLSYREVGCSAVLKWLTERNFSQVLYGLLAAVASPHEVGETLQQELPPPADSHVTLSSQVGGIQTISIQPSHLEKGETWPFGPAGSAAAAAAGDDHSQRGSAPVFQWASMYLPPPMVNALLCIACRQGSDPLVRLLLTRGGASVYGIGHFFGVSRPAIPPPLLRLLAEPQLLNGLTPPDKYPSSSAALMARLQSASCPTAASRELSSLAYQLWSRKIEAEVESIAAELPGLAAGGNGDASRVAQVLQRGIEAHDRVLRPAMAALHYDAHNPLARLCLLAVLLQKLRTWLPVSAPSTYPSETASARSSDDRVLHPPLLPRAIRRHYATALQMYGDLTSAVAWELLERAVVAHITVCGAVQRRIQAAAARVMEKEKKEPEDLASLPQDLHDARSESQRFFELYKKVWLESRQLDDALAQRCRCPPPSASPGPKSTSPLRTASRDPTRFQQEMEARRGCATDPHVATTLCGEAGGIETYTDGSGTMPPLYALVNLPVTLLEQPFADDVEDCSPSSIWVRLPNAIDLQQSLLDHGGAYGIVASVMPLAAPVQQGDLIVFRCACPHAIPHFIATRIISVPQTTPRWRRLLHRSSGSNGDHGDPTIAAPLSVRLPWTPCQNGGSSDGSPPQAGASAPAKRKTGGTACVLRSCCLAPSAFAMAACCACQSSETTKSLAGLFQRPLAWLQAVSDGGGHADLAARLSTTQAFATQWRRLAFAGQMPWWLFLMESAAVARRWSRSAVVTPLPSLSLPPESIYAVDIFTTSDCNCGTASALLVLIPQTTGQGTTEEAEGGDGDGTAFAAVSRIVAEEAAPYFSGAQSYCPRNDLLWGTVLW